MLVDAPGKPAANTDQKILVEFSLTPESKQGLQTFLDKNYRALRRHNSKAREQLQQVIRETFPTEALEELQAILNGRSEYALLIHNCPERQGLEHVSHPTREKTYSYYIGEALYAMSGKVESLLASTETRKNHRYRDYFPLGNVIHRDMQPAVHRPGKPAVQYYARKPDDRIAYGSHLIFSCPYNGEHAITEVIRLKQALESIPQASRSDIFVDAITFQYRGDHIVNKTRHCSLDELLSLLDQNTEPGSSEFIRAVTLSNKYGVQPAEKVQPFLDALRAHSVAVDLQPGNLLVFSESGLFHKAMIGDKATIEQIPVKQRWSRVILHHAATATHHR